METYRVIFNNNRPVFAIPIDKREQASLGVIARNGKKQIGWLAVDAFNAQDSISVANEMMQLLKSHL